MKKRRSKSGKRVSGGLGGVFFQVAVFIPLAGLCILSSGEAQAFWATGRAAPEEKTPPEVRFLSQTSSHMIIDPLHEEISTDMELMPNGNLLRAGRVAVEYTRGTMTPPDHRVVLESPTAGSEASAWFGPFPEAAGEKESHNFSGVAMTTLTALHAECDRRDWELNGGDYTIPLNLSVENLSGEKIAGPVEGSYRVRLMCSVPIKVLAEVFVLECPQHYVISGTGRQSRIVEQAPGLSPPQSPECLHINAPLEVVNPGSGYQAVPGSGPSVDFPVDLDQ